MSQTPYQASTSVHGTMREDSQNLESDLITESSSPYQPRSASRSKWWTRLMRPGGNQRPAARPLGTPQITRSGLIYSTNQDFQPEPGQAADPNRLGGLVQHPNVEFDLSSTHETWQNQAITYPASGEAQTQAMLASPEYTNLGQNLGSHKIKRKPVGSLSAARSNTVTHASESATSRNISIDLPENVAATESLFQSFTTAVNKISSGSSESTPRASQIIPELSARGAADADDTDAITPVNDQANLDKSFSDSMPQPDPLRMRADTMICASALPGVFVASLQTTSNVVDDSDDSEGVLSDDTLRDQDVLPGVARLGDSQQPGAPQGFRDGLRRRGRAILGRVRRVLGEAPPGAPKSEGQTPRQVQEDGVRRRPTP